MPLATDMNSIAGAQQNLSFSAEELAEIDRVTHEGGINLWTKPSMAE